LGDARAASAYDQLVDSAFNGVVERLKELDSGIFVFAPCGCSRAELLKRLLKPGARAELYAQHLPKLAGYQQGAGGEQSVLVWA
jgi:reverse gyrase